MLLKLAILISGRGSNMKAILNAIKKQNIPIKPDMDVLKGVEVIKIVPESLRGKYKIGQNMDMKSRIDLARQILERNSSTAKETLDVMGFRIINNELKLIDNIPW